VSGLTTAVCLADAGLTVRIWTAEPPQATTSVAAGAMWGPYLVEPVDRVRVWSDRTLEELRKLATVPETGVHLVSGTEASRTDVDQPAWGDRLDGFRMCEVGELPEGFVTGWRFTVPAVDMPVYLGYLERRFVAAGGSVEIRRVASLGEAEVVAPVVVNCAGSAPTTSYRTRI
jgi:D-amino-acid oxidase